VGVDFSETGIDRARARAERRGLGATFRVGNALDLPDDLGTFETVLDSGLFHAFETGQRETYAGELARVVSVGGRVFVVGFADGAPEGWGPNPFTAEAVRAAFGQAWSVLETRDAVFETRETSVPGLVAVVERVEAQAADARSGQPPFRK
jgi:ubiquinone/menaquinone biosynthesis C-methylase UbiE